jgi:beta-lactamase class A
MGKSNLLVTFVLIVSIAINIFFLVQTDEASEASEINTKYPLLSKRLSVENKNDFLLNFQPLRKEVNAYIGSNKDYKIEYYFEYLPSGMTIGVNERSQFPAGSLVKIPIILAIYKKIEKGEISKKDLLTLEEKHQDKEFGSFWKKPVGTKITVEEAVKLALIESDNTAFLMLNPLLSYEEKEDAYNQTDISFVEVDGEPKPYVSAKSNASAFKALFLSVYLNQENSSEVLSYLSQSNFNDGLLRFINSDVKVAHKIGVANFLGEPSSSDCGIFYLPKRPYFLCVMVHGDREKALVHIGNLSKMTYEFVTKVE